jgi:D-alanine-D-alanine ligase
LGKKITVGVVFGGRSAEHEVSLVSARSVIAALDKTKYDIIPIGITKSGQWLASPRAMALLQAGQDDPEVRVHLPADPTVKHLAPLQKDKGDIRNIDVIFPVLHGTYGEDGTMQGLIELAGIPYVGAGVLGSAVAMDKIIQKQVCLQAGLPVVDFLWLRDIDWRTEQDKASPMLSNQLANMPQARMLNRIVEQLGLPVFVKPSNLGSSVGITKAHDREELSKAIEMALSYDRKAIIEQAVPDAREIEVSVLGNERPRASVAGEVVPSNEFYDYDAKYVDDASKLIIPADLPTDIHEAIRTVAVKAFMAVEVEGMARVDMLLNGKTNQFFLNELNTIPGFTQISMYPKLWEATGVSYPALLDELIRLAIDRHEKKSRLQTTFKPREEWYR